MQNKLHKSSRYERVYFLLTFAGLGCFLLSFLMMGLAPWTTLNQTVSAAGSPANPYINADGSATSVGRGRLIYIREGCWHCHSQFVRPVAGEPFRYGPASQAWESMYDIPHTYGTRRVGPDLSREAGRRSDDWQFAHLYNPRYTTPQSIMQG
jgi:cbb3-type cytochrome c oxidase subunit II